MVCLETPTSRATSSAFRPRFQLPERPDHLCFRVLALRHAPFPFPQCEIILSGVRFYGVGHTQEQPISGEGQTQTDKPLHALLSYLGRKSKLLFD